MRRTLVEACGGSPLSDTSKIMLYDDFVSLSNDLTVIIRPVIGSRETEINNSRRVTLSYNESLMSAFVPILNVFASSISS